MYHETVLKSLMFGGGAASPTALKPRARGAQTAESQAAPRFEPMIFSKQSVIRASPERVFGFH